MYHLGKLVLLPNFGEWPSVGNILWVSRLVARTLCSEDAPYVHCIGLSLLANLLTVSSLEGVADPWPSSLPGCLLCRGYWCLVGKVGSQGDFLQSLCGEDAWPTGWRSWDLGLGTLGLWDPGLLLTWWQVGPVPDTSAEPPEGSKVHAGLLASGAGSWGS